MDKKQLAFAVRETQEELDRLDAALKKLGYSNRAEWYRDMKRKAYKEAKA